MSVSPGDGITVHFTGDMANAIAELAAVSGVSIPEALRRAVGTERLVIQVNQDGGRFLIERKNQVREVVLR